MGISWLTGSQAITVAAAYIRMNDDLHILSKREASGKIKRTVAKKWKRTYFLLESAGKMQATLSQEETTGFAGWKKEKQGFRFLNHIEFLFGRTLQKGE